MKISRNEPCPCGSGKKYKRCCGRKKFVKKTNWVNWAGLGLCLLFVVGIISLITPSFFGLIKSTPDDPSTTSQRVWSSEHGHWHTVRDDARQPTSFPSDDPASQNRVWSREHGHWHNVRDPSSNLGLPLSLPPEGPAPEGKVWSFEHSHWHDIKEPDPNDDEDTNRPIPE